MKGRKSRAGQNKKQNIHSHARIHTYTHIYTHTDIYLENDFVFGKLTHFPLIDVMILKQVRKYFILFSFHVKLYIFYIILNSVMNNHISENISLMMKYFIGENIFLVPIFWVRVVKLNTTRKPDKTQYEISKL